MDEVSSKSPRLRGANCREAAHGRHGDWKRGVGGRQSVSAGPANAVGSAGRRGAASPGSPAAHQLPRRPSHARPPRWGVPRRHSRPQLASVLAAPKTKAAAASPRQLPALSRPGESDPSTAAGMAAVSWRRAGQDASGGARALAALLLLTMNVLPCATKLTSGSRTPWASPLARHTCKARYSGRVARDERPRRPARLGERGLRGGRRGVLLSAVARTAPLAPRACAMATGQQAPHRALHDAVAVVVEDGLLFPVAILNRVDQRHHCGRPRGRHEQIGCRAVGSRGTTLAKQTRSS